MTTEEPWNKLHVAVISEDNEKVVRVLQRRRSIVHSKTIIGNTPLHLAVLDSNIDLISVLIYVGGSCNAVNNSGETPLHFAAEVGCERVIRKLIKRGANINAEDDQGLTPIEWAAESGFVDTVDLLLALGANPPRYAEDSDEEAEEGC